MVRLFKLFKLNILFLGVFLMQNLNATPRACAVAGSFYSDDKNELSSQLTTLLQNAKTFDKKDVRAIIVPHAGYVFSAATAATAYKTLNKRYKNIFLIGSSHHVNINGASTYNIGNYQTPLGEVKVNQAISSELIEKSDLISYYPNAHAKEHTLEVQLPFLQTIYKDELSIVPIIMATSDIDVINKISEVLKPYFNDDNLFVISTDLSHYPSYEDANIVDKKTLNSIASNDIEEFVNTIVKNEQSQIPNHQTSACGWSSILVLMNLTKNSNYKYEILEYTNSGDTKYGDKDRVVGYGAIRVYKDTQEFFLNDDEKKELKEIAKLALYEAVNNNKRIQIDESKISPKFKQHLGAFVTLYKDGNLRLCRTKSWNKS